MLESNDEPLPDAQDELVLESNDEPLLDALVLQSNEPMATEPPTDASAPPAEAIINEPLPPAELQARPCPHWACTCGRQSRIASAA